jgi:hypothetical protein
MGAALWAAALAIALGTMMCGVKGSPQPPPRDEPDAGAAAAPTSTPNPTPPTSPDGGVP